MGYQVLKRIVTKFLAGAKLPLLLALFGILMFTATACDSQDKQVSDDPKVAAADTADPVSQTTAAPTTTTTNQRTSVKIISVTSPVNIGSTVTLFAQSKPGATCEVKLGYKTGVGEARALYPKQVQPSGLVSWTWTVDSSATPGKYAVTLSAKALDGLTDTVTAQALIELKAAPARGATTGTTCKK